MSFGLGLRRLGLRLGVVVAGVIVAATGCGDPLLPSDYEGQPAAAVTGNVFAFEPTAKLARRPALSIEWLSTLDLAGETVSNQLFGQPLRFVRSARLDNDWDIALPLPAARAKLIKMMAGGQLELSVGKMVYFDDRAEDGRLDWACAGDNCDLIKAVSPEFVVYLSQVPTCRTRSGGSRPALDLGFHYFRMDGGRLREMGQDEPLSFVITDKTPAASNPRADLRTFAEALIQLFSLSTLSGC